jgi:hypothetical protein
MNKQEIQIAKLSEAFGNAGLAFDHARQEAFLSTAAAVEYRIGANGKTTVNYVHPSRRQPDRIRGFLTA